jgi:hypothetical protein
MQITRLGDGCSNGTVWSEYYAYNVVSESTTG